MDNFNALGLPKILVDALNKMGIEKPTDIQKEAIPVLMGEPTDFIGKAQTGTGKTVAFGIPLLHALDPSTRKTQALILCPTRELGQQIWEHMQAFAKFYSRINIAAVYGGKSLRDQRELLKTPHQVIIATPGRLMEMLNRKLIDLSLLSHLVLDEADVMFGMGFQKDIHELLQITGSRHLIWLFSATMPSSIEEVAASYMKSDLKRVEIAPENLVNENITHHLQIVGENKKVESLKNLLKNRSSEKGMIFCRTKKGAQSLFDQLRHEFPELEVLHGDMHQTARDHIMNRFKHAKYSALIATDVAARGIDVQNLNYIFHFNLPDQVEYYTHRSGRTARAGKTGEAISIILKSERDNFDEIASILDFEYTTEFISSTSLKNLEITSMKEEKILRWADRIATTEKWDELPDDILNKVADKIGAEGVEDLLKKLITYELMKMAPETPKKVKPQNNQSSKGILKLSIGSKNDLTKKDLVNFICDELKIQPKLIGSIEQSESESTLEVDRSIVNKVKQCLEMIEVNGNPLLVEKLS